MSQQGSLSTGGGGGGDIATLTGDSGPPVSPDGSGNIDVIGDPTGNTVGSVNTLTVGLSANAQLSAINSWNGSTLQQLNLDVTSDGATITASIEQSGGGDLTIIFSDGYYEWDTTPAATINLAAGTDTSPVLNYIFFLQSTKTLSANTVGFPSTEHLAIGIVFCPSASLVQTKGPYKLHEWEEHTIMPSNQGHIPDINNWVRNQNATWMSGVTPTLTITTNVGIPDNVIFTSIVGKVLQLHENDFPAFTGTPDMYVVNDFTTPYMIVTDLNVLLTDSVGGNMSGRRFSLVIWGVMNDDGESKLMVNLPAGTYGTNGALIADDDKFANFSIPPEFIGTGFLIAQYNLRHQGASGGTWSIIETVDLRGLFPSISAGAGNVPSNLFEDSVFRIINTGDNTKQLAFDVSPVSPATTRTVTMLDADIDLADVVQGPSSATDTALARYDTTTGKLVQDSTVLVTNNGEMTNASQPAFLAVLGTTATNVTGDGTSYTLGDTDDGVALTEIYDQGNNLTPGAGGGATFTAPVAGRYFFSYAWRMLGITASHTEGFGLIITSNRNYKVYEGSPTNSASVSNIFALTSSTYADMDLGDICVVLVEVSNGTKVIDVDGTLTNENTWFAGSLCC